MSDVTGTATYVAKVDGFTLGCEVRLPNVPAPISEVVLRSPDDQRLEASVTFKGLSSAEGPSSEKALRVAAEFLESFGDSLAFERNVVLESFRLSAASFETVDTDDQGRKHYELHSTVGVHIEGSGQFSLGWGKASVDSLLETFAVKQPDPQRYRSKFRSALRRTAGVDRFMAFYRLLIEALGKQGKNQEGIEKFILSAEPRVQLVPSRRNASESESIYTSIRNDISHNRGRVPASIAEQAEQYSAGLAKVVREAIRRRLSPNGSSGETLKVSQGSPRG